MEKLIKAWVVIRNVMLGVYNARIQVLYALLYNRKLVITLLYR